MPDIHEDAAFMRRRDAARNRLDELTGAKGGDRDDRRNWFEAVYRSAEGDPAGVPWADLAPKQTLLDWLATHSGAGRRAIDVACGLGDNAEAMAAAGWNTCAFDFSDQAVAWARERFPDSPVDYRVADLLDLPPEWLGTFDLVHECYTLQALDGAQRAAALEAVTKLVAPRGTLLVITRVRPSGTAADGPPWPLTPEELARFADLGLREDERVDYEIARPDGRIIPHARIAYVRK